MLRKVSEFINLPVINLTSGSQIATVKDLVLDADNDNLLGFICNDKFLSLEKVKSIGKDAVMVETTDINEILETIKIPVTAPLFLPDHILGTSIITEDGKTLGTVGDIILEENTGEIISYEVSNGLLKDLVSGRSTVSILQVVTYGEDAVVVNEQ